VPTHWLSSEGTGARHRLRLPPASLRENVTCREAEDAYGSSPVSGDPARFNPGQLRELGRSMPGMPARNVSHTGPNLRIQVAV
jgi:hypothetical protein